ncbi:hypothetical protein BTO04_05035 [Polaribacter sp. SA4-10]|uniref:hypothetical protein n=1 Tax=Polaribacter sp. SA4-10 TaxID=754397 RepID=UPI000B3D32E9|nr:hypothetical protein [Polaribacter sp. SA4-10]ARV06105.1 hypothetical protein BTO04_05035 [Polaribacter sp. SA4-10]
MENHCYTCQYCKKEFIPKRRKIQKFCSDSCRVSFHRFKNVGLALKSTNLQIKEEEQVTSKMQVDQISTAGVANAAIGTGIVEFAKNIFTREEDKPATKGDFLKLAASVKRYHKIKNLPPNHMGQIPYFDLTQGIVVYLSSTFQF